MTMGKKTFIIAEAGVNHNGELSKALELVDAAADAGADAVKFQTFKPGECTGKFAVKVDYIKKSSSSDETRYDITQKLALPFESFIEIKKRTEEKNIIFLSTPDGSESLDFLCDNLNVKALKIASTEVTNLPFLERVAEKGRPVILSSGLSTLGELEKALEILRRKIEDITILHCVSEYPAPLEEINLQAMLTIRNCLKVKTGFSDHTSGFEAGIAAAALNAEVIEKHFTLDKKLPGPDHKASLNPSALKKYVKMIRNTELILGAPEKKPSASEIKNMNGIRRSVVAAEALKEGTVLTEQNITLKRPGTGIDPYDIKKIYGMKVNCSKEADEPLTWEDLS